MCFTFKIFANTDHVGKRKVDGCWKLVYSTISILGSTRTKLGLRDFISLGDFFQIIDAAKNGVLNLHYLQKEKATNVIKFNLRGLQLLSGQLTIEASYRIASKTVRVLSCYLLELYTSRSFRNIKLLVKLIDIFDLLLQRVDIKLERSNITPDQVKSVVCIG
ncbi:hypothetical protein GW17_00006547 [Ensete ventricosum]|nr:hypothetical protein GW17_00006547 [Ensete ventricosum]